jgi:CRP-like cAMP-binding protein
MDLAPRLNGHSNRPRLLGGVQPMETIQPDSVQNKLLLALGSTELGKLTAQLQRVMLRPRQILVEPNIPVREVYFIEHGIAGVISRSKQRRPMEVSMVGRWGLVGLPAVLGTSRSPFRCIVQVPGTALRMRAEDLQRAMREMPAFQQMLMNYVQARMVQQAQITVCNARHRVKERVARWLLMGLDRLDGTAIPVTHDLLGRMLGIRRAGVTVVISEMEADGILRRGRGQLEVLDRDRLQQAGCHCHGFIRREYERLIAPGPEDAEALNLPVRTSGATSYDGAH